MFDVLNETSTKFGARLLRSWILRPLDEDDVQQVRRILKKMPDVEKQLSAILHHRCRPKDFHSLCRSWSGLNNSLLQFQHHYQDQCDTYISSLVAAIDESLQCVDSFCGALDEAAARDGAGHEMDIFIYVPTVLKSAAVLSATSEEGVKARDLSVIAEAEMSEEVVQAASSKEDVEEAVRVTALVTAAAAEDVGDAEAAAIAADQAMDVQVDIASVFI